MASVNFLLKLKIKDKEKKVNSKDKIRVFQ